MSLFGNAPVGIGAEAFPNNDKLSLFGNAPDQITTGAFSNNDRPQGLSLFGNAQVIVRAESFPNNDNWSYSVCWERPRGRSQIMAIIGADAFPKCAGLLN